MSVPKFEDCQWLIQEDVRLWKKEGEGWYFVCKLWAFHGEPNDGDRLVAEGVGATVEQAREYACSALTAKL